MVVMALAMAVVMTSGVLVAVSIVVVVTNVVMIPLPTAPWKNDPDLCESGLGPLGVQDLYLNLRDPQKRRYGPNGLRIDQPSIQEGRAEHIPGDPCEAFQVEGTMAHGATVPSPADETAFATLAAATPAEKPLSMLDTVTPGAQEFNMARRAANPWKLAP